MKNEVKISNNYISVMYNGIQSYGGSQLWFDGNMRRCGCGVIAAADVLLYLKQHAPVKCMLSDAYIKYVEKLRPAFPLIPRRGMPCFMLALYLKIYMRISRMPYRVGFGAFLAHTSSDPAAAKAAGSSPAAFDDSMSDNKITACAAGSPARLIRSLFKRAAAGKHIRTDTACESRLKSCICDMLTHDIPVILCIGPGVHQFLKPKSERGIMLYSRSETVCCRPSSGNMSPDGASDDVAFVSGSSEETDTVALCRNADASCASADNPGRLSYFTYTPARRVRSHFVVITELSGDYAKVSSWGKPYYISVTELARYSKLDMFGLFTNVVRICGR